MVFMIKGKKEIKKYYSYYYYLDKSITDAVSSGMIPFVGYYS